MVSAQLLVHVITGLRFLAAAARKHACCEGSRNKQKLDVPVMCLLHFHFHFCFCAQHETDKQMPTSAEVTTFLPFFHRVATEKNP